MRCCLLSLGWLCPRRVMTPPAFKETPEHLVDIIADPYVHMSFRLGTARTLYYAARDMRNHLHEIKTDFQVVLGEKDEAVSKAPIQELTRVSPADRKELVMLPHVDHAVHADGNYYKLILKEQIDFIDQARNK